MITFPHRLRAYGLTAAALISVTAVLAVPATAIGHTGPAAARPPATERADGWRGTLVSTEHVQELPARQVRDVLVAAGFDAHGARYGIDAYRLVYRTVDPVGKPTTASGLIVLPRGAAGVRLRTVSYAHGTVWHRDDAPSVNAGGADRAAAITFAAAGFATVAPDYLGLGRGPGVHPWMHAATEVSAALDLLRASRVFAPRHGRILDPNILVSGFSQGGHAAMALARDLAGGTDRTLRLGAVAPISGPYNMGGIQLPAMLSGRLDPYEATLGVAQWTVSWNRLYHFYDDAAEAFQAPYHQRVEALFDSEHTLDEIFAELPGTPQELLTPQYIDRLNHPTGALAAAFAENDATCDWNPRVPARLYAAAGDTSVLLANARHCQQVIRDRGGNVPVTDLGDIDHVTSEQQAVPQIARWFTTLR